MDGWTRTHLHAEGHADEQTDESDRQTDESDQTCWASVPPPVGVVEVVPVVDHAEGVVEVRVDHPSTRPVRRHALQLLSAWGRGGLGEGERWREREKDGGRGKKEASLS